ncbi:MAG: HDOD domain-containing protein [Lysobacteraceae bacterium]|nr:MAG: HDOD domain-containing protein [Xanthomonadaceae bacterium]
MQLKNLLSETEALPSAPQAVLDLARTFEDDDASTADVVAAIESDPMLVVQLLRVANSPVFFRGKVIDNASEAVRLLGQSRVRSLVIGLLARDAFPDVPEAALEQFWRLSLGTAELARHLADLSGRDEDLCYLGGLLHMIGELVLRVAMPERLAELDTTVPVASPERAKAEVRTFGYSYCEAGGELMRRWRLPTRIVHIIERQRNANLLTLQDFEAMVVQIATWRMRAIELNWSEEEQLKNWPQPLGRALRIEAPDVIGWPPLPTGDD